MKSIVFDNAGTIIKRVTALKQVSTEKIIFETNTIGIVNQMDEGLILVFQTPTKNLIKENTPIIKYLQSNKNKYEISYSNKEFTKEDIINALKNDKTTFKDLKQATHALIKQYRIDICSGSALIINMNTKKIEYTYTAGGIFYDKTIDLFKKLNQMNISIHIASGDNKESLHKIAEILKIPEENVHSTCNSKCKEKVILKLQKNNNFTYMVGNNTNDELAIKKADIGILSIQQGETLPDYLYDESDHVINSIYDVLKIIGEEV